MSKNKPQIGTFCLARNKRPGGGYYPRWLVQFRLPGGFRARESSLLPICEKCLTDEAALQNRPRCACILDASRWAEARLAELASEWKAGRLNGKQESAVKPVTLGEVVKVYRERGPEDKEANIRLLELFIRVVFGRTGAAFEQTKVEELRADQWDAFAWCYQEYERKGWTDRSDRPKDAWEQVRKLMPAHPDPDRESATPGNTTIISTMRKIKSVLGKDSLGSYIKPLRDRMPMGLYEPNGWWGARLKITTPDNRFSLDRKVYSKMWAGMPALKTEDPQAWALIRLHWTTGIRPKEARHASAKWLEVSTGENNKVYLVLRNRFEDDGVDQAGQPVKGFRMKDRTTRQVRAWPLPSDLVEVFRSTVSPAGNLLGCDLDGQWDRVYRRASAFLRACGLEGTQTLYNLRKLVGTLKLANEGAEAMKDALGHSTIQTGLTWYAGTGAEIKPLTDEDLQPESVLGHGRQPFKLVQQR